MDEFNFDLTPITVPVTIGGKKYTLHEASETVAKEFRDKVTGTTRTFEDGTQKHIGLGGVGAFLVSRCLTEDDTGDNVPEATLLAWPSRIVGSLYDKAKEISGLNVTKKKTTEADESAKN